MINPEAEHVPDDVFRAVHTDFELRLRQGGETGAIVSTTLSAFRQRFLDPNHRHVQAVVIGTSGTGKSHLIQWLRLAIPELPTRRVINIPKAGTSLRGIVERLIGELPPEDQTEFRDALAASGHSRLSQAGRVDHLLDNLALAISNDEQPELAIPNDLELAEAMRESLPALFRDPYLRKAHFTRDKSFVSTLVRHVYSAPESYERTEERREFRTDDLPRGGLDRTHASRPAQDALDILLDESLGGAQAAVDLVNRNLDSAISLSLSFAGDRVIELMNRLRVYFKKRGQELVLLIEDLARLQGIDYSLLQALIEQGGETMCSVRWAIAVTTGFYKKLPDTVRSRISLVVDMDVPADRGLEAVDELMVTRMAARYLNAARLGKDKLLQATEIGDDGWLTVSGCEHCEFHDDCHRTFGAEDGYGLFPWTHTAIREMGRRSGAIGQQGFNPRTFQVAVLQKVLAEHHDAIARGEFPSKKLLDSLGGLQALGTSDELQLKSRDIRGFERRLALLELWDGQGTIKNLTPGVHEAFSLPPLEDAPSSDDPTPTLPTTLTVTDTASRSSQSDPAIDELAKWARGSPISQRTAQRLRELLYQLVVGTIDWDGLGWDQGYFTSGSQSIFKAPAQIAFENQTTAVRNAVLRFPADPTDKDNFKETSLAFQGLLQFHVRGDWSFKDGGHAQALLLEVLESAASCVVDRIREYLAPAAEWDPLSAACELLLLGRCLEGRVRSNHTSTDLVAVALEEAKTTTADKDELSAARKTASEAQKWTQKFILAQIKGLKNGSGGIGLIDPTLMHHAARSLKRSKWRLTQRPPAIDRERNDLDKIARAYSQLQTSLDSSADAEQGWYRQQVTIIIEALGPEGDVASWKKALETALDVAEDNSLVVRAKNLRTELDKVNRSTTTEVKNARAIAEADVARALLPSLGRGRRPLLFVLLRAIQEANKFLDNYERAVENKRDQLGERAQMAQEAQETITKALHQIGSQLRNLGGDSP